MIKNNIRQQIVREYLDKKCSQMFLGRKYGVNRNTIKVILNESNAKEHYFKKQYLNEKDILNKYVNERIRVEDIAKDYNCSIHPINDILRKHKVKRKQSDSLTGRLVKEKNPNWRGGKTSYGKMRSEIPNYSTRINKWRKSVNKLCGNICYLCLKKSKVDAHHIISVREIVREKLNSELVFDSNNGITICRDCHKKIHYKEKQYREHFLQMIKLREFREEPKK
jgi:hypothetical protein